MASRPGMYLHPTNAVTPTCEPLGILDTWMCAGEAMDAAAHHGASRGHLRWSEGHARLAELAPQPSYMRLVYVAGCEADMVPLVARAQELGMAGDWLVRVAHTSTGAALGKIAFGMPAQYGVKTRTVRQQLRAQRVELLSGRGKTLNATRIVARRYDALPGVKPIKWRLLTNDEAVTTEAAIEPID